MVYLTKDDILEILKRGLDSTTNLLPEDRTILAANYTYLRGIVEMLVLLTEERVEEINNDKRS